MSTRNLDFQRRDLLVLASGLPLVSFPAKKADAATPVVQRHGLRDLPFDSDWLFLRETQDGFEKTDVDDLAWRRVTLPHDWSVEDVPDGRAPDQIGPFDKHAVGGRATGFTVGGQGWYRKRFTVNRYPTDARIEILFGGAYLETDVWLNGHHLGQNVHGYIPFAFDLTPFLVRDAENVLAVRVRNTGKNTRWYAGSGLYRQVTLDVLPARSRLARWGIAASTRRLAAGRADIAVATEIEMADPGMELCTRLRDASGTIVAEAVSAATKLVDQVLKVRGPRLWAPSDPALYTLETELRRQGQVIDQVLQPFGIRIVTFDPHQGMMINGKPHKLYGGCIHHDNGLLGARAFADADDRRVRLLKARGFNAIRSSHNPASHTLRDACDRFGMLLIEEAFDVWHEQKEPQDFHLHFREQWEHVLESMVRPARNSPSVIMWSIGNEIPSRSTDEGIAWSWKLANKVKALDPTRPVTAALNGILGAEVIPGASSARPHFAGRKDNASTVFLDVPGYNYRIAELQREFATHPERVIYGSETFPKNVFAYAEIMRTHASFLGEFVWTAMDYIGEAGIGAATQIKADQQYYQPDWPWINAWCGDLDLIGHQKAQSLARDVAWGVSPLEVTVRRPLRPGMKEYVSPWGWPEELVSWNWSGSEGVPVAVQIYSAAERVEVRLNGTEIIGRSQVSDDKAHTQIMVPYAPGTLEVIAYAAGREVGRRKLVTVDAAASLRIATEAADGGRGRQEVFFVPVSVLDAQGRMLPDDERAITLTVDGPADLLAFGSAGPFASGSLQSPRTRTYRGQAMAILRARGAGTARVVMESPGLRPAQIVLKLA